MKLADVKSVALKVGVVALAALPLVAGAQPTLPATPITGYSTVTGWISTLANWFFGILLAIAVIFILYSAFLYLTSGGDEEKVKKAKSYLVYAIIAVAIGLLARGIVYLVATTFFRQTIVQ